MFARFNIDSKIFRIFFVVMCFIGFSNVLNAQNATATRTITKLDKECNNKNINSCSSLALIYLYGDKQAGVKQNGQKAMSYYAKGCDASHIQACYSLYLIYSTGQFEALGVKKDSLKAFNFAVKACNLKYEEGCKVLAQAYEKALGAKKDFVKYTEYLIKSCNLENYESCKTLGDIYYEGKNVTKDLSKAREYLSKVCIGLKSYEEKDTCKKACDMDEYKSCVVLGDLFYETALGLSNDYGLSSEAQKVWDKACNAGLYDICVKLGDKYLKGEFLKEDETKAAEYYKKACDGNFYEACNILGEMYYDKALLETIDNGEEYIPNNPLKGDIKKAMEYYTKACDNNLYKSCIKLGDIYYDNLRVEIFYDREERKPLLKGDIKKAMEYYTKACDNKVAEACDHIRYNEQEIEAQINVCENTYEFGINFYKEDLEEKKRIEEERKKCIEPYKRLRLKNE